MCVLYIYIYIYNYIDKSCCARRVRESGGPSSRAQRAHTRLRTNAEQTKRGQAAAHALAAGSLPLGSMTSTRRRRALRSPPIAPLSPAPPPSRSYHRPTPVPRQRDVQPSGVVTLTAAGVSRRVAASTSRANVASLRGDFALARRGRARWWGSRTPFGTLHRVASVGCAREEKRRRALEGRRCRRHHRRAASAPRYSSLSLALGSRPGDGVGTVLWRRARRRVHWNSVPSERCNALSSLPDSVSEQRFPLLRARRKGGRRNARGERRVSDDRFRR